MVLHVLGRQARPQEQCRIARQQYGSKYSAKASRVPFQTHCLSMVTVTITAMMSHFETPVFALFLFLLTIFSLERFISVYVALYG